MSDPPATSQSRLLELADRIYEAGAETGGWPSALRSVATALGASGAHVLAHDFEHNAGDIEHSSSLNPEQERLYAERYARSNPWLACEDAFRMPGGISRGDQIIPQSQLLARPFYKRFMRPRNVFHTLHLLIDREGERVFVLLVERPRSSLPFTREDVRVLRQLYPVLRRALRVSRALGGAESLRSAVVAALDAIPLGVCIVSAGGGLLSTNRTAREFLTEDRGVRLEDGSLRFADPGVEAHVQAGLERVLRAEEQCEPLEICLAGPDSDVVGDRALQVVVSPVPVTSAAANGRTPLAAVFLVDPDRHLDVGGESLRALYSLTPAESRLALQLADGLSLHQASERLGVSYQTSRSHLKRIFAKTHTERQPELMRALLNGRIGRICL